MTNKKKTEKVPESHRPNRAERRHSQPAAAQPIARDESPPKDIDTGRGRRRTTAENWNQ